MSCVRKDQETQIISQFHKILLHETHRKLRQQAVICLQQTKTTSTQNKDEILTKTPTLGHEGMIKPVNIQIHLISILWQVIALS